VLTVKTSDANLIISPEELISFEVGGGKPVFPSFFSSFAAADNVRERAVVLCVMHGFKHYFKWKQCS